MGEEVKIGNYSNGNCTGAGVEDRVSEWEVGLPTADDLTPLSQSLIPPELASAFRISPEPFRSMLDVNRASQNTMSSLLAGGKGGGFQALNSSNKFNLFHDKTAGTTTTGTLDHVIMDVDDTDLTREGSDSRKTRREGGSAEEADSATNNNNNDDNGNEIGGEDGSARTLKRPRLVWTPQLHKRFVDVVAHLGIKNAVPKTIMQLMNVEGLTRENVASHLQKYRLYLKRMQGLSTEGPSSSDHLFSSTPVPHSLQESGGGSMQGNGHGNGSANVSGSGNGIGNGHIAIPFPMQYPPAPTAHMVPFPMIQMPGPTPGGYYDPNHHHHHHQYGMMQQPMDWSGNKFGSVVPQHYYHVAPNDK